MRRLLSLSLLLAAGCPSASGSLPIINSFSANPTSVHLGNPAKLSWDVTGATALSLDNGLGNQTGLSVTVTPTQTTTYTLTASNGAGQVTAQSTVTVLPAVAKPVITAFQVTPSDAPFNSTASVSWTVTGAVTGLSLTDGVTTRDITTATSPVSWVIGSQPSYTFTLTATNDGGSVQQTFLVTAHSGSLHLDYTDPVSPTAKIKVVKSANSTANRLVLDVKVGASDVTGVFGFAMNIPVQAASNGMVALDTNLSPAGLIAGPSINFGATPSTAAAIIGGPAMPNIFSVGVAKRKASAGDGDVTWPAGSVLFSIAFTMTGTAAGGITVFDGAAIATDPKFRAAALNKAGTPVVTAADIAIGSFQILM